MSLDEPQRRDIFLNGAHRLGNAANRGQRRALITLSLASLLTTASACSEPRKASVRFVVHVQASDAFGTYSSIGIWRSELQRPLLPLNRSYDAKLIASPIIINLSQSGRLTVYPTSQLNGSDGPFLIPQRLFAHLVHLPGSEQLKTISVISSHVGASARMNCHYDKTLDATRPTRNLVNSTICPSISFQRKGDGLSQELRGEGESDMLRIARSIIINVKILGG
jgi:hypothetical protein